MYRADPAHFDGLGGDPYDPAAFDEGVQRAEACRLATNCCVDHGARIVAVLLEHYTLTPRSRGFPYP